MKIVVTGGHLTPAYSFIEEAQSHKNTVLVIGSLGKESLEATEFAKLHIDYKTIFPVKYDRYQKIVSLLKLPVIIYPIMQSLGHLLYFRPDKILVFGGFTALPVALAAYLMRIPVYLHEQTRTAGLANRIISRFAAGCAISYQSTAKLLRHKNTIVTGNLLRRVIWNPPDKIDLGLVNTKPILFSTGGNQGSATILRALEPLIPELLKDYQVVIQYGNNQPPNSIKPQVIAKPWFEVDEMAWLLAHAKIVICRGGANTTAELMIHGTPSIIIPLPNASQDEQTKNAAVIADHGAGIVIAQSLLTVDSLRYGLAQIGNNYQAYKAQAKALSRHQDASAAHKLYQFITAPQ